MFTVLNLTSHDLTKHFQTFGTTGIGRTESLQSIATQFGMTTLVFGKQVELTEEQLQMKELRLNEIRESIWRNLPDGDNDLGSLHDVLVYSDIAKNPTTAQIKAFFMILPQSVVGTALSWGFSDTVVRDHLCEFIRKNRQDVLEAVSKTHVS